MDFPALEREVFSKFSSPCLHPTIYLRGFPSFPLHVSTLYNLPERFFKVSSPCFYTLQSTWEVFQVFLSMSTLYNLPGRFSKFSSQCLHSTIYLRGFPSFPLHVYNSTFSNLPEVFANFFLSTTLHPSTYQVIYIPSPQFYIPPRTLRLSQHFYTPKPTISNPYTQTQEIKWSI